MLYIPVYSISLNVEWPQHVLVFGGNVEPVVGPVLRAAAPTSSCEFWELMPGSHSPEVHANVNIKSMLKSVTRWT